MLPKGCTFVFDSAGHSLQIERKELFDANVSDWLERVEIEDKINKQPEKKCMLTVEVDFK